MNSYLFLVSEKASSSALRRLMMSLILMESEKTKHNINFLFLPFACSCSTNLSRSQQTLSLSQKKKRNMSMTELIRMKKNKQNSDRLFNNLNHPKTSFIITFN